ncbi:MAG: hypothetical protein A2X86_12050 [Bdellovibrionales bacterium GWA2_49_15]|nr:MAG: hypothetical protein A2X86_12050 [Bdellovibrionales bacterium GWA2_49_15]
MNNQFFQISPVALTIVSGLVLAQGLFALRPELDLGKTIISSAIKGAVQLALIATVLIWIFAHPSWYAQALVVSIMVFVAVRTILRRMKNHFPSKTSSVTFSLCLSVFPVALMGVSLIQPHFWQYPSLFLPLFGMILGNSMNGVALGIERFMEEIKISRLGLINQLSLGATPQEATAEAFRKSLKAATTPILNTMSVVGIVSLPGMMSGQILAGGSPLEASKYQIYIIFLVFMSVFIGSLLGMAMARNKIMGPSSRSFYTWKAS